MTRFMAPFKYFLEQGNTTTFWVVSRVRSLSARVPCHENTRAKILTLHLVIFAEKTLLRRPFASTMNSLKIMICHH